MSFIKIDDVVDGKSGEAWMTQNGVVKELVGLQKVEFHDTINERKLKTVGTVRTQTAPSGVDGAGTMTVQYGHIKTFASMVMEYRRSGKMPIFDLLIINNDPGTSMGRRSVSFEDCRLTGDVPMAALDADSDDGLTCELNFSYSNADIQEEFADISAIGRE